MLDNSHSFQESKISFWTLTEDSYRKNLKLKLFLNLESFISLKFRFSGDSNNTHRSRHTSLTAELGAITLKSVVQVIDRRINLYDNFFLLMKIRKQVFVFLFICLFYFEHNQLLLKYYWFDLEICFIRFFLLALIANSLFFPHIY
jgi:hypothetical protein